MQDLLLNIYGLYNIELQSFERVTKGFLSENHILFSGDNKKYFLKRYRFDNKERIEEIHLVKKYFADGGIPVIFPVVNNKQETFFYFDTGFYALFPFVEDRQIERGELTENSIISLGEMLGQIHLLGKNSKVPIKEKFKVWDKAKSLEKVNTLLSVIQKIDQLSEFDTQALNVLQIKKQLIENNDIGYNDLNLFSNHLIHGDYLDHNVFFGSNGRVSKVFDFEKTDYSPRVYEVYRSLMYSFLSNNITDSNIEKAKFYLDSYLKVYPASKDELSKGLQLFYLKSIHSFWVETEHYLHNSNRVDGFLLNDFYRIEYLSKNFSEFEGALLG